MHLLLPPINKTSPRFLRSCLYCVEYCKYNFISQNNTVFLKSKSSLEASFSTRLLDQDQQLGIQEFSTFRRLMCQKDVVVSTFPDTKSFQSAATDAALVTLQLTDSYMFTFSALARFIVTKLRLAPEPLLLVDTDNISAELQQPDTHKLSGFHEGSHFVPYTFVITDSSHCCTIQNLIYATAHRWQNVLFIYYIHKQKFKGRKCYSMW